ncbi:MAG: DUF2460 domain-containing protein [Candidatus Cryosericum sp.]
MSYASYPSIPVSYSVSRRPLTRTEVQTPPGNWEAESLAPLWDKVRSEFTLNYKYLNRRRSPDPYEALMGFYQARMLGDPLFWFDPREDKTKDAAVAHVLGTGDGSEDTFQIIYNWGGYYSEIIKYLAESPKIYLNDVLQESGYVIDGNGAVVFTSPPGSGVEVSASFSPLYLVRFAHEGKGGASNASSGADGIEFENFQFKLWRLNQVDLIQGAA